MNSQSNPNQQTNPSLEAARTKLREKSIERPQVKSLRKSEINWSAINLPSVNDLYDESDDDPFCVLAQVSGLVFTFQPIDPLTAFVTSGDSRQLTHLAAVVMSGESLTEKQPEELSALAEEDRLYQKRVVQMAVTGLFVSENGVMKHHRISIVDKQPSACNPAGEYPLSKIPPYDLRLIAEAVLEISAPQSDMKLVQFFRGYESNGSGKAEIGQGSSEGESVGENAVGSDGRGTQAEEPEPSLLPE